MNRRKIRKAGYKEIVKKGKSHQEVFDELKLTEGTKIDELSVELSKIPSSGKNKETTNLRYIYIAALAGVLLVRVLGALSLNNQFGNNTGLFAFVLLTGIALPIIGIYGALTSRVHVYYPVGMLLAINLFRSFSKQELVMNSETIVVFIPFILAIILAFYIPSKLKTPFTRTISKKIVDGNEVTSKQIVFEDSRFSSEDILDS